MNEQPALPSQNEQIPTPSVATPTVPPSQNTPSARDDVIEWEASEYVHHSKSPAWAVVVCAIAAVLVGLTIWMQAYTFTALIVVMAIAFIVFAFRQLHYRLDRSGLHVRDKFYPYEDFRAYGLVQDGALFSVMMLPAKRLMPTITMYFEEKDGEAIVDAVGRHLPMQDIKPDLLDLLMRRLRF
jgi:uncharacterized membrane protein YobD (UPF0266 family)